MPVQSCQKDGVSGHKWGPNGVCFTGSDSRARAAAVGRAIKAKGGEVSKVEEAVASLTTQEVVELNELLAEQRLEFLLKGSYPGSGKRKKTKKAEGGERTIVDDEPIPVRATIKKADEELQIVWGEVYVPGIPDAHGHFMTSEEVRKMAYRTLASGLLSDGTFQGSDVQHDNLLQDCVIVESFIARKGDETFLEDSWVVGLHVRDPELWGEVKKGALNGFSIQASVYMHKQEVEVDIPEEVEGETDFGSDGDLHRHGYRVRFNAQGEFLGGRTTSNVTEDGSGLHDHEIRRGSVTEPGGADKHTHRFALLDMIFRQRSRMAD